jgi:glucosamine-phosphate N-acetyltransferase
MQIRKANQDDLKEILDLLDQLSPSSENPDIEKLGSILEKITKDENYYLCVVEEDKKIIGTGTLLIQMNLSHNGHPYAHIENIVVDKHHRKKGIGKFIISYLIEKAKQSNCYKVILNCKKENVPFYERCSFDATGEIEMRLDF